MERSIARGCFCECESAQSEELGVLWPVVGVLSLVFHVGDEIVAGMPAMRDLTLF